MARLIGEHAHLRLNQLLLDLVRAVRRNVAPEVIGRARLDKPDRDGGPDRGDAQRYLLLGPLAQLLGRLPLVAAEFGDQRDYAGVDAGH